MNRPGLDRLLAETNAHRMIIAILNARAVGETIAWVTLSPLQSVNFFSNAAASSAE